MLQEYKQPTTPLVSIIVPVYNVENYLESCINSILTQSYKRIEVILVDDGSTDSSGRLCDKFVMQDRRVRVIHQTNAGVSAARNAGLDVMTGEYFAFVDSDDLVYHDYISLMVSSLRRVKSDMVLAGYTIVNDTAELSLSYDNRCSQPSQTAKRLSRDKALLELLYGRSIRNQPFSKLFATDEFGKIRFNTAFSVGEDMDYIFRCLMVTDSVTQIAEPVYFYMYRENSVMHQEFSEKRADSYRAALSMYENTTVDSRALRSGLRAKLFTEAVSVGTVTVAVKGNDTTAHAIYDECVTRIKRLSAAVFLDIHATAKQRIISFAMMIIRPKCMFYIMHQMKKMKGN